MGRDSSTGTVDPARGMTEDPPTARSTRPTFSDRLPRPWLFPLLAFAVAWVILLAGWQAGNLIYHNKYTWAQLFLFKDAAVYAAIAQHGYYHQGQVLPPGMPYPPQLAFFPLLPLLVRYVGFVPGLGGSQFEWTAGLVVMVVSGAWSSVAVWALAARVRDRWTADRAILLFCAFPGAMTFAMLYSEPLAIALAATSLLAAMNRRWLVAGVLGLLASAEHSTMIVLAAALGIAAIQAIWQRREWRALVAPVLTPLGMLGYFTWLWYRYHDFFAWDAVEKRYWRQRIDFGRNLIHDITWTNPQATHYVTYILLLTVSFAAVVLGILLMIYARVPVFITVYTAAVWLSFTIASGTGSKPRLAWTAFGIFIAAGAKLPRIVFWPLLVLSAAVLFYEMLWWPNHLVGPSP
jgi:hypothetical protein